MTKYNRWGEPMPERLTGELGEAWALVLMNNEYFDGEDGIAYGAQQRLIREWRENKPAEVIITPWGSRGGVTHRYGTAREAYRVAVRLAAQQNAYVTVRATA